MQLIPAFAVPIAITNLANNQALNQELKDLFLRREAEGEKYANKQRNSYRNADLFESRFDLFAWPEPCIKQLRDQCLQNLFAFVTQLCKLAPDTAKSWEIHADAWYHITRFGGYFTAHNHPNASWSLVYCVSPGESSPEHNESGVLRFLDFKAGSMMYLDPANTRLPDPYALGNKVFLLKEGDLVIFPSYLVHEVAPFFGRDERITVAANCWFKDKRTTYPG